MRCRRSGAAEEAVGEHVDRVGDATCGEPVTIGVAGGETDGSRAAVEGVVQEEDRVRHGGTEAAVAVAVSTNELVGGL